MTTGSGIPKRSEAPPDIAQQRKNGVFWIVGLAVAYLLLCTFLALVPRPTYSLNVRVVTPEQTKVTLERKGGFLEGAVGDAPIYVSEKAADRADIQKDAENPNRATVDLKAFMDSPGVARLSVGRGGWFSLLPPIPTINPPVTVAQTVELRVPPPPIVPQSDGSPLPGENWKILIQNLPKEAQIDRVTVNNTPLKEIKRTPEGLSVKIPDAMKPGKYHATVTIDGKPIPVEGDVVVKAKPLPPPVPVVPNPAVPTVNGGQTPPPNGSGVGTNGTGGTSPTNPVNGGTITPPFPTNGGTSAPNPNGELPPSDIPDSPSPKIVEYQILNDIAQQNWRAVQDNAPELQRTGGEKYAFFAASASALALVRQNEAAAASKSVAIADALAPKPQTDNHRVVYYLAKSYILQSKGDAAGAKKYLTQGQDLDRKSGETLSALFPKGNP